MLLLVESCQTPETAKQVCDLTVKGKRIGDVTDPREVVRLLEIDGKITTTYCLRKNTHKHEEPEIGCAKD